MRHVGEKARLGAVGLIRSVARDLQLLDQLGQLGFVLFQFGDVCVGRNNAAVGGPAFADPDPTPVAALLHVGFAGGSVALEAFLQPGIAASFGILDKSAVAGGADNRLEARSGDHDVRVRRKELPIAAIADDELVIGIVQRETLRDGFDCISEAGPRFANFL